MFALEITFQDGVSQSEMIFIRRPQALIGSSDYAHVVVEDLKDLNLQLRLVRDLGRKFRCKPLGAQAGSLEMSSLLEGVYEGDSALDLGPVKFHFTALDSDLLLKEAEPPDRAGVRVLRQACASPSPLFPAVAVGGANPMVISFVPDQPIYIGRSKQCALRLDSADISARHARMGYESGEFWIEDLGSTNGTFVNQQQISGRVNIKAGVPVILGREISLIGITAADQIDKLSKVSPAVSQSTAPERKYPILLSVSEVARPARMVIQPGTTVNLGRDPSSELWLGAPHVSRRHCAITMSPTGALVVNDYSTNGTAHDKGLLRRGDLLEIGEEPCVFDFGGGVTVGICFNEEQERTFVSSQGSPTAFRSREEGDPSGANDIGGLPTDSSIRRKNSGNQISDLVRFYGSLNASGKLSILLGIILLGVLVVILLSVVSGLLKG